jgi:hypothetical protein
MRRNSWEYCPGSLGHCATAAANFLGATVGLPWPTERATRCSVKLVTFGDAVQDHVPLGLDDTPLFVGVFAAAGNAAAGRKLANPIRQPLL